MDGVGKFLTADQVTKLYRKTINLVFAIILLFITLTMIIGVIRLFYRVTELLVESGITGSYLHVFTDVLTLFILIELSRSLFDYFSSNQLRLTPIIDAGIVFVLRHIMIDLYGHKLTTETIYALSVLLLALAIIRVSATIDLNSKKYADRDKEPKETTPG